MKITDQQLWLLEKALYWQLPLIALLFLFVAIPLARNTKSAKIWLQGALLGAVLVALLFAMMPPKPRMQDDEAILASVAGGMVLARANVFTVQAIPSERGLVITRYGIDKRPPLFPFLVSVLHGIFGESAAQAYRLNAVLLTFLLALVFAWVRVERDWLRATAAVFAALAPAGLVWCASSGGFDLLAALMLFALGFLCARFVESPGHRRLALLLLGGLLYCNARYESTPIFLCLLGAALFLVKKRWAPGAHGFAMIALFAVGLLPLALIHFWLLHKFAYYGRDFGGLPPFGASYLPRNLAAFLKGFLRALPGGPFAGPLNLAGLAMLARLAWRRQLAIPPSLVPLLCALGFGTAFFLFYSYGDVTSFSYARFYLPAAIAGALGAALLLPRGWAFGLSLALFLIGTAAAHRHGLPQSQGADITDSIDGELAKLPGPPSRTLFVTETWCPYLITRGYGCVDPEGFKAGQRTLLALREKKRILEILFLQTPALQGLAGQDLVYPGSLPLEDARKGLAVDPLSEAPARILRLR